MAAVEQRAYAGAKRAHEELQARRDRVSMSEMSEGKFTSLFRAQARLILKPVDWPDGYTVHLQGEQADQPIAQPAAFSWEAGKDEDKQHEQYLAHAKRIIPLPRELELLRAPPALLSTAGSRDLPFDISGTTDICIILKAARKTPSQALHVVIELKPTWQKKEGGAADEYEHRAIQSKDIYQACAELVAADILSPLTCPVVLLTNFDDEWIFFWLEKPRTIVQVRVHTRITARVAALGSRTGAHATTCLCVRMLASVDGAILGRGAAAAEPPVERRGRCCCSRPAGCRRAGLPGRRQLQRQPGQALQAVSC